ncbi:hypothetical protein EON68_03675, partial [archaeon]
MQVHTYEEPATNVVSPAAAGAAGEDAPSADHAAVMGKMNARAAVLIPDERTPIAHPLVDRLQDVVIAVAGVAVTAGNAAQLIALMCGKPAPAAS